MLNSFFVPMRRVALPVGGSRQLYMHGFDVSNPVMAEGFEDYLRPVKELLSGLGLVAGQAWMTVDEKVVKAGHSQRRPGPHVDGKFNRTEVKWGGGGGWNHSCNIVPTVRTPVIVASDVEGCRAWSGDFDTVPGPDGDLSHIVGDLGVGTILEANRGWLLGGDCIHESMIFEQDTQRTFLRIALPQLEGVL
jgi:hypothetical protein